MDFSYFKKFDAWYRSEILLWALRQGQLIFGTRVNDETDLVGRWEKRAEMDKLYHDGL